AMGIGPAVLGSIQPAAVYRLVFDRERILSNARPSLGDSLLAVRPGRAPPRKPSTGNMPPRLRCIAVHGRCTARNLTPGRPLELSTGWLEFGPSVPQIRKR